MEENCIFCKIIAKDIETDIVWENDSLIVFHDREPSAQIHLLVVPKKHVSTFVEIEDKNLMWEMTTAMQKLIRDHDLTKSQYRVLFNGGSAQHIKHVHWHLVGGLLKKAL